MAMLRFITFFSFIALYSCQQGAAKREVDPAAVKLNDSAMKYTSYIHNVDSLQKAISLLDSATSIESNYFLGHYNKLMFFNELKQYDKAILTINSLIKLRPSAHDLYLTGGILHERMGDTTSSKAYFQKSMDICNNALDTMAVRNSDYIMLISNKAINLIMLGEQAKADELLQASYNRLTDAEQKQMISSMMNKNKQELLMLWSNKQ